MKCSIESCKGEAHEELTIPCRETGKEYTVCPDCFEKLTDDCAECIINPIDGDEDLGCNECMINKAESLEK